MRKALSIILAIVMLSSIAAMAIPASAATFEGNYDTFTEQMKSTPDDLYVEDAADMEAFLRAVRGGEEGFASQVIHIINDITFNDEWVAAYPADITTTAVTAPTESDKVIFYHNATTKPQFWGTIDGHGHTVKGIYAVDPVGGVAIQEAACIFGRATNATIKNIRFENCYVESAQTWLAGLFSVSGSGKTVTYENVYADIDVVSTHAGAAADASSPSAIAVGGFLAYNAGKTITITDCVFAGTIHQGNPDMGEVRSIGGFVGHCLKNTAYTFERCGFFGKINFPAAKKGVGKLLAHAENVASNAKSANITINVFDCVIGGSINCAEGVAQTVIGNIDVNYTTTTSVNISNLLAVAARVDAPVVPEAVVKGGTPTVNYVFQGYKILAPTTDLSGTGIALSGDADVSGQLYDLTNAWAAQAEGMPLPKAMVDYVDDFAGTGTGGELGGGTDIGGSLGGGTDNGGSLGGNTTGGSTTGGTDNGTTNSDTTTTTDDTTAAPAEEKKGCGSSIGLAGIALVATVATVGVVAKKKED